MPAGSEPSRLSSAAVAADAIVNQNVVLQAEYVARPRGRASFTQSEPENVQC